ncbi:VanZ family protein [Clostridium baratii]|uniref:VanZ family protein n=1 Tax=Clostridium baratii TaxID=1561 RepID=UPI001C22D8AA|nr:VanZ family protein [Clostridium baratii]
MREERIRRVNKNNTSPNINKEIFMVISVIISTIINIKFLIPFWGKLGYQRNTFIQSIFITLTAVIIYVIFNIALNKEKLLNHSDNFMIVYIFFLIGITFFKSNLHSMQFVLNPFSTFFELLNGDMSFALINIIGNLLMYVPVGIYIRYKTSHETKEFIILFIIYILIVEFIQGITKTGTCDMNDVLMNTIGFIIGMKVYDTKLKV